MPIKSIRHGKHGESMQTKSSVQIKSRFFRTASINVVRIKIASVETLYHINEANDMFKSNSLHYISKLIYV